MTHQTRTAWTVAGILAVIVIILLGVIGYGWYERKNNLGYVLEDGQNAVMSQRQLIRETCSSELGAASAECQAAIQELANFLIEFRAELSQIQTATSSDIGGQ